MAASSNIFAFFGTDEAQVKDAALTLSRQIAPADDEFGLEIISGGADNSEHASQIVGRTIEAIQTLPFFGGEKVVWLQDANFFADNQTGRAETTLSAVEALVGLLEPGLPPEVKLILSASEVDKRRSFYKKIKKLATVKTFDKVDVSRPGWEALVMSQVRTKAKALNLAFEGTALERFVLMVGAETRMLDSELEKLSLYVGDRPATEEDVVKIAASSHIGVIFAIGDAIARKNLPRALDLIDRQLAQGENAVGILLAAIVPKMRNLLHARDLVERHGLRVGRDYKSFQGTVNALPAAAVAHLPRKKDGDVSAYPIFLAAQESNRFTADELKTALEACLEANVRLVTTALDPGLVLGQLVTRILTRPAP
ncbi:MAG: DNA polymerase III subunit delta [Verrucomicrobiales bacterium]